MLNVVRVEFSKLRRWKLLRVLPLLSLVLPAITFSYFATHPDYLTDMGLYKQALFSFNIFLILPAILGVLASMLVYNEQRCDVLKQLWIIPVSKGGYLFAKWVVVLTGSLAFMMLAALAGTNQAAINRYETDRAAAPYRIMVWYATYFNVSLDYIFGLCEDPRGRYVCITPEGAQEVVQRKPDWSEFVEACFTPGSELNRRLKQMILNMGEEEKHK